MSDRHNIDDELAMPQFEDRLWGALAEAYALHPATRRNGSDGHRAHRSRRGRRPGRRSVVLAVAGLAAAVTVVVVAAAWPDGHGAAPPRRVETIDVPEPAVVVDRVLEATEPAAGEPFILHETVERGEGIDVEERWYDDVTFAERRLTTTADGEPLMDSGWPEPPAVDAPLAMPRNPEDIGFDQCVGGLALDREGNLYSCDTGEPVDTSLPPAHPAIAVDHCAATYSRTEGTLLQDPGFDYLRLYLETGDIVVDGPAEHDGRQLIRLRNHDSSYVYLVDPDTYLPVVAIETSTGSPPVTRTYERLPRTEENLALLSPALPEGYTEVTSEEVPQDSIDNPCEEHPSEVATWLVDQRDPADLPD